MREEAHPMATIQLEQLRASVRGAVIQPGDGSFETARKVYNAMIDKRPALIAECADVADVIAAVNFGRDRALPVAIRCGGTTAAVWVSSTTAW